MGAAALLSFREGLEAALIVGIVLGYLAKIGQPHRSRSVWVGVLTAVVVSVGVALALYAVGAQLEGAAEEIFEGVTMLAAAVILTWMIFWMQARGGRIKGELESRVQATTDGQSGLALFSLTFLVVVREGIELALFLTATMFTASAADTAIGAIVGLTAAIAAGWAVLVGARHMDLRLFFTVTGALLLIFAAGLVGRAAHELQEASLLPGLVEHLWSTKDILNDKSSVGSILKTLIGYNDDPSLLQVLAYTAYVVLVAIVFAVRGRRALVQHKAVD